MGRLRIALVSLLLTCAAVVAVRAQDAAPAHDPEPAQDAATTQDAGVAPDAGDGSAAVPTGSGYEPDQRGVIEDGLLSGASQGAPAMDMGESSFASEQQPPPPWLYLELQPGYGYLDPSALQGDVALDSGGHHGFTLGLAAGLHLGTFDFGLRYAHGFYQDGLDLNAVAFEARLGLLEGELVPQLRLALGVLALSDVAGAGAGGQPGTLVGVSLEPGIGARLQLDDVFSLGAAVDLGFSPASSASVDAAGLELRLHLDLGVQF